MRRSPFLKSFWRMSCLVLYYSVVRWLPSQPIPGYKLAYVARRAVIRSISKRCGRNVLIKRNAYFGDGAELEIGDYSQFGENCVVPRDLVLGRDVVMGPDVVIWASPHESSSLEVPIRCQGGTARRPVRIGDDVWIGQRAIIMPGVRVGSHAVIGAASVVTRDVPEYSVVAGVPARVLRMRNESK
jgi:maltose O-acetyltransferase